MKKLTIKITRSVPLEAHHGITEGSEWEVEGQVHSSVRGPLGYWIRSKNGALVKILPHECEVVTKAEGKEGK